MIKNFKTLHAGKKKNLGKFMFNIRIKRLIKVHQENVNFLKDKNINLPSSEEHRKIY